MEKEESRRMFLEFIRQNCLTRESHCYSRKIVTSKKCDFCKKALFFVALRCKGCRQNYHRKCARHAPATCHVTAPTIPQGDALQSTDQWVTRDRRVPAGGENVSDFLARNRLRCERTHSDSLSPIRKSNLHLPVCRSEGNVPNATELHAPTCDHGIRSPGGGDSVFCDNVHHVFFSLDQEHSNHSSLSQGYCSQSESEETSACQESPTPTRARGASYSVMRAEDRRKMWSSTSVRIHTIDTETPTKSTDNSDHQLSTKQDIPSRIGTWPTDPFCHEVQNDVGDEIEDRVNEWFKGHEYSESSKNIYEARERLKEWTIGYSDFKFRECISRGRDRSTYRGQWHGDVLIHTRSNVENIELFLDEVATLSMIRHENVVLFMGACIDEPHLSIITSVHKGPSLYTRIHLECGKMSLATKINIARQIAQGMSYLHAKDITVPHLRSRTVFLESKVKICMMRDAHLADEYERPNYACLQKGEVQYVPPEILRNARVIPPYLTYDSFNTTASDVFAFGTILFEVLAGRFPYQTECLESIVYKVCKGQRSHLDTVKCPIAIKIVQEQCWTLQPDGRPTFSSILARLSQNVALVNRRHSLSERDLKCKNRPW